MSTREDLLRERLAQLDEISQRRNGILRQMYEMMKGDHAVGSLSSGESQEDTGLNDFLDRLDLNKGVQNGSITTLPDSWFELPPLLRSEDVEEPATSPGKTEDDSHARLQLSRSPPALSDRRSRSLIPSSPFHDEVPKESERRSPSLLESVSASPGGSPHPLEAFSEDADLTDLPSLSRSHSPVDEVVSKQDLRPDESNENVDDGLPLTQEEYSDQLDEDMVVVKDEFPDVIEVDETEHEPEFIVDTENIRQLSEDRDQELQMAISDEEIILPTPTPDVEDSENIITLMSSIESEAVVPSPDRKLDLEDLEDISLTLSAELESNLPHTPPPTVLVPLLTPYATTIRPTIRAPSPIHELDFNFDGDLWAEASSQPIKSPTDNRVFFNPHYSIPPLDSLPPEFQRKKPSRQQRKREKDKDRSDSKRDDWAPLGMNKWRALLRANPTWKHVSKSSKSLTTKDWNVALTELRLMRTFDRIETLKDNGRWSFRQPKKQRGVGGLVKTHWDYLMDEMRWMRIDFREERKWKIALAYKIAISVQEWHAAGTIEERVRKGICVVWPRSHPDENSPSASVALVPEEEDAPSSSVNEDLNTNPQSSMQIGDYGSDDGSDDDPDKELGDVDPLDANGTAHDTLQNCIQPKVEDVEEYFLMSLQMSHPDAKEQEMDVDTGQSTSRDSQEEMDPAQVALKPTSQNPLFQATTPNRTAVTVMAATLRERIAYSDTTKLFLDVDDIELEKPVHDNTSSEGITDILPPTLDLSVLFPDLQPYGLLEVVPAEIPLEVKKNNRRERDDPNRRAEDTTYSKLTPVSKFMYCRPTLIGPLQPSRYWSNGEWSGLDDCPVYPSDVPRSQEGSICALFDRSMFNSSITKPPGPLDPKRIPESHIAEQLWSLTDDQLLRSLVDIYHNNWALIADAFNTSRISVSTDRRTAWDCYYRYTLPNTKQDAETPTSATNLSNRPKRQVAMSASEAALANAQSILESKKRKRHIVMQEAIRKVAKKRDAAAKAAINQKRQTVIHDTHGQYNKMPKLTPQELGRLKAEKDYHEHLARQRAEELRVKTAREQQVRIQQGAQNSPTGVARVASNGFTAPAQPLPALRTTQVNISQQQRLSNPMATAANARLSPQHQQAVQAQVRAMAAAQQSQVHGQVQGQPQQQNGQPIASSVHTSPTLSSANQSTSSPSISLASPPSLVPSSVGTPVSYGNGNSITPRPSSTQPQPAHTQIPNNMQRAAVPGMPSVPQYYASVNIGGQQFASTEHVEQTLRFIQAHQRQQIPGSQQTSPPPTQVPQTQGLYPAQ